MKVFVALACLAACAQASLLPAAAITTKLVSTGSSTQTRTQDAAGNYAFAYSEQGPTGGSSRSEKGSTDGWNNVKVGSYSLNVGDGRQRVVKYVADGLGFRAAIATNEPGTAAQPAAATSISSPYLPPAPVVAAAPIAVAAPAIAAPAIAGPVLGHGLAAPIAVAAPIAKVAIAPAVSSYSSAIEHAAPVAIKTAVAAPLLAAPALAAPVLAAPALAGHGLGAPLGLGLAGHGLAAPALAGHGLAAPALGLGLGLGKY